MNPVEPRWTSPAFLLILAVVLLAMAWHLCIGRPLRAIHRGVTQRLDDIEAKAIRKAGDK